MEIILGPWKVEMSVDQSLKEPFSKAMAEEAAQAVKDYGYTSKVTLAKPAPSGFTISGRVTSVTTEGRSTHVKSIYEIWVDGTLSNVKPVPGDADALKPNTPEDALRAVTESRVKKLLDAVKAGRVLKAS